MTRDTIFRTHFRISLNVGLRIRSVKKYFSWGKNFWESFSCGSWCVRLFGTYWARFYCQFTLVRWARFIFTVVKNKFSTIRFSCSGVRVNMFNEAFMVGFPILCCDKDCTAGIGSHSLNGRSRSNRLPIVFW